MIQCHYQPPWVCKNFLWWSGLVLASIFLLQRPKMSQQLKSSCKFSNRWLFLKPMHKVINNIFLDGFAMLSLKKVNKVPWETRLIIATDFRCRKSSFGRCWFSRRWDLPSEIGQFKTVTKVTNLVVLLDRNLFMQIWKSQRSLITPV